MRAALAHEQNDVISATSQRDLTNDAGSCYRGPGDPHFTDSLQANPQPPSSCFACLPLFGDGSPPCQMEQNRALGPSSSLDGCGCQNRFGIPFRGR